LNQPKRTEESDDALFKIMYWDCNLRPIFTKKISVSTHKLGG